MSRLFALITLVMALLAAPLRAEWSTNGDHEVPIDGNGSSWLVHATLNGNVTGRKAVPFAFLLASVRAGGGG